VRGRHVGLGQGNPNLLLEGHLPAEFSSRLNETHLNQLIKVFRRIISNLQEGVLELNSSEK